MARRTGYTAENPPGIRSAATAPLVRIPYRSMSDWASACARIVASAAASGSSDQRPLTFGGPVRDGMTGRPKDGRRLPYREPRFRAGEGPDEPGEPALRG